MYTTHRKKFWGISKLTRFSAPSVVGAPAPHAAAPYRASGFVRWHETDMPTAMRDVRSRGQSRKHILAMSLSGFDPNRTLDRLDLLRKLPTLVSRILGRDWQ